MKTKLLVVLFAFFAVSCAYERGNRVECQDLCGEGKVQSYSTGACSTECLCVEPRY